MYIQYLLIFVWMGLMWYIQPKCYRCEYDEITGNTEKRATPIFAFAVILPVILLACLRGWFGDTTMYILHYRNMSTGIAGIVKSMATAGKDKGFYLISCLLKLIFGEHYILYLITIAFFQGTVVCWFFRKYSENYTFSIFLFIASTDYVSWMFNGIRQFTAVSILLLATPLVFKKKWAKLTLVILLAATIHSSALIVLPIAIIANSKPWSKKSIIMITATVLCVVFVDAFTNILNILLANTQYSNLVSEYTSMNDDGTNPLRVLVYSIPAIIAFLQRKKINELNDPIVNYCTNMSVVSTLLYIVSMFTSGVFIGRLPIYCSMYSYILLPWELNRLSSNNSKKIAYFTAIIGYFIFYFLIMHFQNQLI